MKNWSCLVFAPNRPERKEAGVQRKFKNFWKIEAWRLILLKLDKLKQLIKCYERWSFWNFLPNRSFGGEVDAKTLLKRVLTAIQFLHWILIKLSGMVCDNDEWRYINFQGHWVIRTVKGARRTLRANLKQPMWKISFGLSLRRSFDSISLKLDRMVGTMEKCRCIVFELNRPNEGWRKRRGHANSRI